MKKCSKLLCIVLCLSMILGGFSFAFAEDTQAEAVSYMRETVETLGEHIDGEEMFDYLSYVYLGWRTTGGSWQNQVIDSFVVDQLEKAGYTHNGAGTAATDEKSANDMSSATDKDYSWVTYYDVDSLTWDPEYAKLELSVDGELDGAQALIDRINVESYGFNPTSDAYINHYKAEYGINSIDDMWKWITEKDANGNRVNVINGKEAELNLRVHLARDSCFTDAGETNPADAKGVTGEVVYVGTISGNTCSEVADVSTLAGKVILTDSSLRSAFTLAQNVGAVAVASKASLSSYSTPRDENGNILEPFDKSARFASGASLATTAAQTATGKPIVEWQFSNDQYDALRELLKKAADEGKTVTAKNISIGRTYAMNDSAEGGKGQAVTFAEIKGSTKPEERIILCAHVQEPSSNDNATGFATLLGIATQMKKMVDEGAIERPERTITFMWGDEMTMARLYLSSHEDEKSNIICSIDLDMTGEDPDKTGGVMRIEKTPDPSAIYNYTLDTLPWEDGAAYDENFKDSDGNFVRLPDSHTLWGAGSVSGIFAEGYFLNDLYMYASQNVIAYHDSNFQVDVCPYEGGSDHSVFLKSFIPALLTWHFTDYTYHTSVDTLNMSSADEMENVGITSLATALMIANTTDENQDIAVELLTQVRNAALDRFDIEQQNTLNHQIFTKANGEDYAAALENEKEVLEAWETWYQDAFMSIENNLLDNPSAEYKALRSAYALELELRLDQAKAFAEEMIGENPGHTDVIKVEAKEATAEADGNIEYWYCQYCGKYFADEACTEEITYEDTIVKYVPESGPGSVQPDADNENPNTGDPENIILFAALLAASAAIGGVSLRKRKYLQ